MQRMTTQPKLRHIVDFPVAKPTWKLDDDNCLDQKLAIYAEPTYCGNLLCYLKYSGRFFRCSEERVRNCIDSFIDTYRKSCQMLDEDPAHTYYEVFCLNDLYKLFPIAPTIFGELHGYTNVENYRTDLKFKFTLLDKKKIIGTPYQNFGEPIFIIEPEDEYCCPTEYFREV